jgi:phosphoglucomutase/phosphomannomutase
MEIKKRAQKWLEDPFDPATKDEVRRLIEHDEKGLSDAFFKDLSFGTGGMRGIMGVGTNRINIYTIRMATQGLANYLKIQPGDGHRIFIGYDVRHHSREFAEETAKVFAGNGMKVLLSQEICPTPLVSFACRYYRCSAAVMITASHNPPQYNGYKVYWNDGAQVVAPHDQGIMDEVGKIKSPDQVLLGNHFEEVGSEIDDAYLEELKRLQMRPELAEVPLKIVYTNLHGTGIRLILKALKSWGYSHLSFVEKQLSLDGDFPFAPSPNPEDPKALKLGQEQLAAEKGDILVATDPDGDRIGVADLKTRFSGNQMACLCLHHICTTLSMKNEFPQNGAFLKTIVTTELFKTIAEHFGGKCIDVLTGFKYIAQEIGIWEAAFDGYQFLFGAEESYGSLFGTFVRDKDAISAACLIAEMAALAKKQNLTLTDRLYQIYQKYGLHRESLTSIAFSDSAQGMEEMSSMMQQLRKNPPSLIGGVAVQEMEDYLHGYEGLPPSDVLRFWLADGSKLVIRPSGTEPKVKIYAEVVEKKIADMNQAILACDERLKKMIEGLKDEIRTSHRS